MVGAGSVVRKSVTNLVHSSGFSRRSRCEAAGTNYQRTVTSPSQTALRGPSLLRVGGGHWHLRMVNTTGNPQANGDELRLIER